MSTSQHVGLTERVLKWLVNQPGKAKARSGGSPASNPPGTSATGKRVGKSFNQDAATSLDSPPISDSELALQDSAEALAQDAEAASFAGLMNKLGYLEEPDIKRVREAYRFADEAHLGQFRASGEPYITHPIAVAGLCADWKLDAQAIMAALMHDVMEDCGVTKVQLIEHFDSAVAELVDGLTKLDKIRFSTREEGQAESFRKMLLAMSRDVRVILIKLADRLHNMRTLGAMAFDKRSRIARETLDIYAPIAHRLGLNQTYRELQDLSFEAAHPWRYGALIKAVKRARGYRRDIVERIHKDVNASFSQFGLQVQIVGREKELFSIYRKMRDKHLTFAQVSDLIGFRVIVPTLTDCYVAMGLLHQVYKPMPGRFKDYIAIPKANGYQSLHTTLVSPLGTAVEFQIRTEPMHQIAERGIAAHWLYKSKGNAIQEAQRMGAMWLQSLLDIQDETHDASEFLEHIKIDLFPDAVYVFTPKSKILALPRGATPVDFAYAIHSDVGDHCVAARVNGQAVALRTELRSGDVVEIVSSPQAKPNPSWLNFVRTGRARSKIRHYLKSMEQAESELLGEKMLKLALRAEGYSLPADQEDNPQWWGVLTKWSGNRSRADLLTDIGLGRKVAGIVAKRLAVILSDQGIKPDPLLLSRGLLTQTPGRHAHGQVYIDGSEGASVRLASCCLPIPGDDLVGYLGRGEGLQVHRSECPLGKRLHERDPDHFMHVEWSEQTTRHFETRVALLVSNGKGVLAQVASAVAETEADITHIDMGSEPAAHSTELALTLSVRDRLHLADVIRRLRRAPAVLRVSRGKSSGAAT